MGGAAVGFHDEVEVGGVLGRLCELTDQLWLGDGRAAERIAAILTGRVPEPFPGAR